MFIIRSYDCVSWLLEWVNSVWTAAGSVQSPWLWLTGGFWYDSYHCVNTGPLWRTLTVINVQHLQSGLHWWSEWNQSLHILHSTESTGTATIAIIYSINDEFRSFSMFCWYQAKLQPAIPGSVLHSIVASRPSEQSELQAESQWLLWMLRTTTLYVFHQIKSTLKSQKWASFSSVTWNKSCQNPDEAAEEIHGVCWFCNRGKQQCVIKCLSLNAINTRSAEACVDAKWLSVEKTLLQQNRRENLMKQVRFLWPINVF